MRGTSMANELKAYTHGRESVHLLAPSVHFADLVALMKRRTEPARE